MHKVVARFADGRVVKGFTNDFFPDKPAFHINVGEAPPLAKGEGYLTSDLKALYFVKDFAGNPQHDERREFDPSQRAIGRKIRVVFKDGEELVGTTQGYQPGRPGFFLVPADPESNMDRCYVVAGATNSVTFI